MKTGKRTGNPDLDGSFVVDPGLTNLFEYHQKVLGIYGTGSYEGDVWGLKLGIRVENTNLSTLLVNTNEDILCLRFPKLKFALWIVGNSYLPWESAVYMASA